GLRSEDPIPLGHVDSLHQQPAHLLVGDFALLEADAQVEPDELAVSAGHPRRNVGVFVHYVQPDGETVIRQQPRVEVRPAGRPIDLVRTQIREHLDPNGLSRLGNVYVTSGDWREAEWGTSEHREVDLRPERFSW